MLSHTKPTSGNASLLGAWHAQVAATARQSPWLVREMLRRKRELLPKFTAYYQQLRALPRRTRRLLQRKLAPSLAGAALLLALGGGDEVQATTIAVGASDEAGLIAAITTANSMAGADTIVLTDSTFSFNAEYADSTALPTVTSEIVIEGNGSTISRVGGSPKFRLFRIASTGNLTISETTISGGSVNGNGGGLLNEGGLHLTDCTVTGNSAGSGGGVSNVDGVLTVTNSAIMGNRASHVGGGMENYFGTFTMTNSTISSNSASDSGGVYNGKGSTFTMTNSTISGNTSSSHAGGVETTSTFTLTNSTITGNRASSHGGGVFHHGDILTLTRTLVSGNTASTGSEISASDTVTANDFNLFGHDNDAGVVGFSPGVTDLVPSVAINAILDPLLSDNGGPTLTHALVPGSPAIDASPADADCEPTDQRGVARPQGVACDIGAFEVLVGGGGGGGSAEICGNCLDDDGDSKIDLADEDCPALPLSSEKGAFGFKPDPDEDQISLTATFPLGPAINPPTEGATVQFFDAAGQLACVQIPAGTVVRKPPGWKVKSGRTGTTWSFSDAKDGSLGDPTKDKLSVQCNTNKDVCTVRLNVKAANIAGDATARDITTGVIIGNDAWEKEQGWQPKAKGKKLGTP